MGARSWAGGTEESQGLVLSPHFILLPHERSNSRAPFLDEKTGLARCGCSPKAAVADLGSSLVVSPPSTTATTNPLE